MTFLGLELPAVYEPEGLFNPAMALMVLNTRNNYINALYQDYLRDQQELKDFTEKYGDFSSIFRNDVNNYYGEYDKVKSAVDAMYNNGDLLRTQEGRMKLRQIINMVDRKKLADAKKSAEQGDIYMKALQQMKANNTYNQGFNDWYMMDRYGTALRDWDSSKNGVFGEAAPQAWQDVNEATRHMTDQIQKGLVKEDDQYEYWGKNQDSVREAVRGAIPSLTSDYWRYQRALVDQALGPDATQAERDKAFEDMLVNSRAEDWNELERKEKPEYTRARQHAYRMQEAKEGAALNFYYDMLSKGVDPNDPEQMKLYMQQMVDERDAATLAKLAKAGTSKYGHLIPGNDEYHVTEEIHHDGIFNAVKNLGIPVTKLTVDKDGNVTVAKDKNGKPIMIPAYQATHEELDYAASHKNNLLSYNYRYMLNLKKKYKNVKGSYIYDKDAQQDFVSTFGYNTRGTQFSQFVSNKKVEDNGAISLDRADLDKMQSISSIMQSHYASGYKVNEQNRLMAIFGVEDGESGEAIDQYQMPNGKVTAQWIFDENDPHNTIQIPVKTKSGIHTEVFFKGTARIKNGSSDDDIIEVTQWMPAGLTSNEAAMKNNVITASDMSLNESNRSAYKDIDAGYAKDTGSQKRNNVSLD